MNDLKKEFDLVSMNRFKLPYISSQLIYLIIQHCYVHINSFIMQNSSKEK